MNLKKINSIKTVKEIFGCFKKNTQFKNSIKGRKEGRNIHKMVKRTLFSRPTFSKRRSLRPLTSLAATLCLASGILIGTTPSYAAGAQINVTIANLGNFKCAQVLFGRSKQAGPQPLGQSVKANGGKITGTVSGAGMFSINFYPTADCSGKRALFQRFATTVDAQYSCDITQSTVKTGQSEDACKQDS